MGKGAQRLAGLSWSSSLGDAPSMLSPVHVKACLIISPVRSKLEFSFCVSNLGWKQLLS